MLTRFRWTMLSRLLALTVTALLVTAGVAAAGEAPVAAKAQVTAPRGSAGVFAPNAEGVGSAPVSAAYLYEGFIGLNSHTHNATYTYTEGDIVHVQATAQDPDDWGMYLMTFRIWDNVTHAPVRSYWASSYVFLSQTTYANVDLSGLVPSSGRYRIEALLWDDDLEYYEDGEWLNLTILAHNPTATIDQVSPKPVTVGSPVTFTGHLSDADHAVGSYQWTSSIDGTLSTEASFSTSALTPGTHTIYFKAACAKGKWSPEVSTTLTVYSHGPSAITPTIVRVSPSPVNVGSSVAFSATATDTAGHAITAYQWRSSKNGVLSTSAAFSTSGLSEGTHTIYVKAKCAEGIWSPEVSRSLTVRSKNAYVKSVSKSTGTWSRSWSKYRLSPSYTKLTISRTKSYVKLTPYRESSTATIYMKIGSGSYSKVSSKRVYVSRGRSKSVYVKCVPQAGSAYSKTYKIVVARRR